MSTTIASLFDACPAIVPQFKVVTSEDIAIQSTQSEETQQLTGAERRLKQKTESKEKAKKLAAEKANDTRENRTVFVGNVSLPCNRKVLKQLFKKYGTVETVRLRSFRVKPGDLPKKVAQKRQMQLVDGSTCNAYVVMSTAEEAEKSLALSGTTFKDRHLRVDLLGRSKQKTKDIQLNSIFVGNVPFDVDDEKLRNVFVPCGQVEGVRIIRDKKTGIGKGFGFVTFSEKSGVMFSLQKSRNFELNGRTLRVTKAKSEDALKMKKFSGMRSSRPMAAKTKTKKKTGKFTTKGKTLKGK